MATISVACDLAYEVYSPTDTVLNISAANCRDQRVISERFAVEPRLPYEYLPSGLSGGRLIRLTFPTATQVRISYEAVVEQDNRSEQLDGPAERNFGDLPADVYKYLNPSRYCESDRLAQLAHAEFGALPRGYSRVVAIVDWVNSWLTYVPDSTNSFTTAAQVVIQRQGVCRDYAHLAIALCRGLGIPARYVSGYAVDLPTPDFHGFFEAFLDDRWYPFEPTKLVPTTGLVRIATGTDATQTAFTTICGSAWLSRLNVSATYDQVVPLEKPETGRSATPTTIPSTA